MKRVLAISVLVLLSLTGAVYRAYCAVPDSTVYAALDARLEEYLGALRTESLAVQKEESDFLIESCSDSLVRQYVALKIYDHYLDSPVMGSEAVAIYVLDRWFFSGKIRMHSEIDLLNARVFADFNRRSQLGEKAPELVMLQPDDSEYELFTENDPGGRYRVLYFYDVSCAKCKVETILLRNLFVTEDYPVELYAIYAGDSREAWDTYRERFTTGEGTVADAVHLWDPELDSDFQRKYGVVQTPRMFLVGPDGTILGRGLDTGALSVMLHGIFTPVELEYGNEDSAALFDGIFGGSADPSLREVAGVADHIAEVTLEKGDTVMFRQMTGDLLYYLAPRSGGGCREGAGYLVDNYILSRPDIWRTKDDSLKVVGFAGMVDDLLAKAVPGTEIADLAVPGELLRTRFGKVLQETGEYRLRKLHGRRNVIIFHTDGCGICKAEKEAAVRLLEGDGTPDFTGVPPRKIRILLVNIDEIISSSSDDAPIAPIFDSFDLTTLPLLVETDRRGIILRRYFSLQ